MYSFFFLLGSILCMYIAFYCSWKFIRQTDQRHSQPLVPKLVGHRKKKMEKLPSETSREGVPCGYFTANSCGIVFLVLFCLRSYYFVCGSNFVVDQYFLGSSCLLVLFSLWVTYFSYRYPHFLVCG